MTLSIALDVEADAWRAVPEVGALIERAIAQAEQRSAVTFADRAEVSVLVCDDAAIRALNGDWRGIDRATNVLSFPAPGPLSQRPILGDIAVAWDTTRREAADEHKSVGDHLAHLVVHGFLHLVGHDHDVDADADAMENLETSILADLGIADPYADSEPVGQSKP